MCEMAGWCSCFGARYVSMQSAISRDIQGDLGVRYL